MSADAFAVGNSVAFRTSPDLHTAAHEAAHVVQQRQGLSLSAGVGVAGDEYEQQADAVADAVVQRRSAAPLLGPRPAVAPFRSTSVQRKERSVDARTYLLVNLQRGNSLTPYIISTLRRLPLALPSPFATWRQGPADFLYKVARQIEIETGSVESLIRKLDVLLLPTRLDHLVDQSRTLEPGKDDEQGNARGSSRVFADVGIRIANALHRTVHTALPRVLERYLEARCGPGAEPLEDAFATGSRWREPHAFMIPASHPIDPYISSALCDDSVVVNGEKYRAANGHDDSPSQGSAAQENATGKVEWSFLHDDAAPNWIEVTSPASVTVEQVSEALFGTPKAATAITAAHPYYGLELADARAVRKRHGLPTAPAKDVNPMDFVFEQREDVARRMQNMRDPAFGLANSAHADDAALAQAGQLGAASADRGALMKTLERSRIQVAAAIDTANRFGLGKGLAAVQAQIESRLQRFSGAPDSDVAKWQLHATKQHDVLFGVSRGLSQVAAQLDAMGVKGSATPAEIPDVVWQPLYHVVHLFVDTAAISHLVEIAFERLAAAETELRLAPLETLDLILDDVRDKIEATRQTGKEISTAGAGKYKRFDTGDAAREESELRQQIAVVRAKMLDEDPQAGALISELYARVSKMQTESDLAYNYAVLAQLSTVFHELKTSSWSVAAFQDDDAERYSHEAFDYAHAFQRAYGHFIDGDEAAAKQVIEKLRNNEKFKTFLERAHSEIDDIQTKTKIVQIATIVGIVLVSMVTGPVGGGLARRAGAGMVGQFIAASATEALTYSALDAAVFGNDSVAAMFLSEFGVNLATFGLLRAWKASRLGKHADDALAATKLDSATRMDKLKGYAFKGADLTAQGMLIAAAGFAQMQYDAYRQTGRYVSVEEMFQLGREGLAMVVAAAIGGKLLQRRLDALEDLIAGPAGKELAADYQQLSRMAKAVEQSRDPQAALELVRADRRVMEAELRALERAGTPAGKRARARRASELRDQASQLDIAELSLSLEEVVPGRQFMGTPEELAPFLDRLRGQGAEVQRQTMSTGDVRYVVTHGDRRITLHEARHYTTTAGGNLAARDPVYEQHSVAGYVDSLKDGEALIRRLAAGDATAVAELGINLKGGASPNAVEWGLGRQWDGKIVVVVGSFQDIDWGKLPHIDPLSHSHPATEQNRLRGEAGSGEATLDAILDDLDLREDRLHLLPSPGDLAFLAVRGIEGHGVVTPFRHRGRGRVSNAKPNDSAPVVEFVVVRSNYVGRWALNPDFAVYKAELRAIAGGEPIAKPFTVYGLDAGSDSVMRRQPLPLAKNDRRGPPAAGATTGAPRSKKLTSPSKAPDQIAEPRGKTTRIRDNDDAETRRGLARENDAADILAKAGYDVDQNPDVPGTRNPDLRIEGRVFDVYSPDYGTSAKSIFAAVKLKAATGQATRVVINLANSRVRRPRLEREFRQRREEAPEIEEVLVIKQGAVFRIYP